MHNCAKWLPAEPSTFREMVVIIRYWSNTRTLVSSPMLPFHSAMSQCFSPTTDRAIPLGCPHKRFRAIPFARVGNHVQFCSQQFQGIVCLFVHPPVLSGDDLLPHFTSDRPTFVIRQHWTFFCFSPHSNYFPGDEWLGF